MTPDDQCPPRSFAERRARRYLERQLELQRLAPELVPVEVTDGIRWTLLARPYPDACRALCAHIRDHESRGRAR